MLVGNAYVNNFCELRLLNESFNPGESISRGWLEVLTKPCSFDYNDKFAMYGLQDNYKEGSLLLCKLGNENSFVIPFFIAFLLLSIGE